MQEDYYESGARDALLVESVPSKQQRKRCCWGLSIPNPRLFVLKSLFVWAASFAFIPLMALNNEGRISAVAYASILVALHVLFLVIYFWRVPFRDLDRNWRSLAARCLGLFASVYLLYLVAGSLSSNLGLLAIDLVGLCMVHTLILTLLTVKVDADHQKKQVNPHFEVLGNHPEYCNDDGAIQA